MRNIILSLLCLLTSACGYAYYTGYMAYVLISVADQNGKPIKRGEVAFYDTNGHLTALKAIQFLEQPLSDGAVSELVWEASTFREDVAEVDEIRNSIKAIISSPNCDALEIPVEFRRQQVSRSIAVANEPLNRYVFKRKVILNCKEESGFP